MVVVNGAEQAKRAELRARMHPRIRVCSFEETDERLEDKRARLNLCGPIRVVCGLVMTLDSDIGSLVIIG